MSKRRLIRVDKYCWGLQEWQEGGGTIERGRFAGQTKQAKWKMPHYFYGKLAFAAKDLLNETIGDIPDGTPVQGKDILDRIEKAEKAVVDHVNEMLASDPLRTDVLIGILQERGYTVTNGKKGRKTLADDEPPPANEDE